MLLRYILVMILLFFTVNSSAHDKTSSIYHPLPLQEQGLFLTAKKLFHDKNGGLWLHDIYGNIRFYDGQHVLPRAGSVLDKKVEEVAFLNGAFWYVEGNKLYKAVPAKKSELVISLEPEVKLKKMGSSNRQIWMTDNRKFYVYNPDSMDIQAYPLKDIISHQHKPLQITNAIIVKESWVFGTTSGAYIYRDGKITHVRLSQGKYIEALYYSAARQELLVGEGHGAIIVDVNQPEKIKTRIGHSLVRAVLESKEGYWIGTEHGLYIYQFSNQKIREIDTSHQDDYALSNNFIYSLAGDDQGGIWIATSKEIRYFSLYSDLFERIRFGESDHQMDIGSINKIETDDEGVHWIATDKGLYSLRKGIENTPSPRLYRPVYDLALDGDTVWLATDRGIAQYHKGDRVQWPRKYPSLLRSKGIRNLAIDSERVLWFDTPEGLVRYQISGYSAENLGYSWVVNHWLGKITHLYTKKEGQVFIGTDHGTYLYSNGRIRYLKASAVLGQSIDMVDSVALRMWFVNSYGLYYSENRDLPEKAQWYFEPVMLSESNIRVQCTVSTDKGIWALSSKGLSYYQHNGKLAKHFSAPFGLVNNEFLPDTCSYDPIRDEMIFGSRYGLVLTRQSELLSAELPESKVLFSQIVVNNQPYKFAYDHNTTLYFPYDSSLNFIFGVLPDFDHSHLQYLLEGESEMKWIDLQGAELAFSTLFPGEYQLYVRTEAEAIRGEKGSLLKFVIQNPWYLSPEVYVFIFFLIVLTVVLLVHWRSIRMLRKNRNLQELVRLKTSQLEHQSQTLIASNHQLRIQLKAFSEAAELREKEPAVEPSATMDVFVQKSGKMAKEHTWLKKVYALLEKEYMSPEFGTSLAAKSLYVSERSLQRKFKQLTGKTFTEQLNIVRLEKACELLLSGRKISDAAFEAGFNDPSYFSLRFKNYFGTSPSKFIESRVDQTGR